MDMERHRLDASRCRSNSGRQRLLHVAFIRRQHADGFWNGVAPQFDRHSSSRTEDRELHQRFRVRSGHLLCGRRLLWNQRLQYLRDMQRPFARHMHPDLQRRRCRFVRFSSRSNMRRPRNLPRRTGSDMRGGHRMREQSLCRWSLLRHLVRRHMCRL